MPNALHAPRLAIVLVAALMAACSQSQVESTDHSAGDAGHASGEHGSGSSAGLPTGRADAGDKLAHDKGKATGQSCVDCHGADGNAPIDPVIPNSVASTATIWRMHCRRIAAATASIR